MIVDGDLSPQVPPISYSDNVRRSWFEGVGFRVWV